MTHTEANNLPAVNFDRLTKLLMMTTSDFDGEALAAMRKANSLLKDSKKSWQDIFQGLRPQASEPPKKRRSRKPPDPQAELINKMFEKLFETVSEGSSFREFIDSVHAQWTKYGRISPAQRSAIERAYQKALDDTKDEE